MRRNCCKQKVYGILSYSGATQQSVQHGEVPAVRLLRSTQALKYTFTALDFMVFKGKRNTQLRKGSHEFSTE